MIDQIFAAPKGIKVEDGYAFAVEHRINYELPNFYKPAELDQLDETIEQTRTLVKEFQGILSMHGPMRDINVISEDPAIRKVSRQRYEQAIVAAKELNIRYVILHSHWTPLVSVANKGREWASEMADYWEELIAEHLEDTHITILLENAMDESPDLMNHILGRLESQHLKACLDTGHVNLFSDMSVIDWLGELGHNLAYIHASNNNGEFDEHEAFDKGIIDMESFLNHLALLPHKVHLAMEMMTMKSMDRSYDMLRPYLKLQAEQFASKSFLI